MFRDISMTVARHELTSLPEKLSGTHDTVSVTRRGKPVLAILPWEEYESILETLDILGDKKLMSDFQKGIRDLKRGKGIPWEMAKKKIHL